MDTFTQTELNHALQMDFSRPLRKIIKMQMPATKKYRYYIGIDPGIKTGLAVWNSEENKFQFVETWSLHKLFRIIGMFIRDFRAENDCLVFIENPNTFIPFKRIKGKRIPKERIDGAKQGAGAVKQTFKHIIEFLEDNKIPYQTTRLQGGLKKKSSDWFKQQTGWKERTDEHGRDSALLVWQR